MEIQGLGTIINLNNTTLTLQTPSTVHPWVHSRCCLHVNVYLCIHFRRWSSPVRSSCQRGSLRAQITAGRRRRISSSGSVNGGLAGGIHPSFTTQKRKMVDLPHLGVPLTPTHTSSSPLSICLCPCGLVALSCLASCGLFFLFPSVHSSAPQNTCVLHFVNGMCHFQHINLLWYWATLFFNHLLFFYQIHAQIFLMCWKSQPFGVS